MVSYRRPRRKVLPVLPFPARIPVPSGGVRNAAFAMHRISQHFNKTRVDFYSIDVCYFSPHNGPLQAAVVLAFLVAEISGKEAFAPMNDTFMKTKPVFPLLVSMALPNVISMLVNSLYTS
mgnify:CR=1 FL=1